MLILIKDCTSQRSQDLLFKIVFNLDKLVWDLFCALLTLNLAINRYISFFCRPIRCCAGLPVVATIDIVVDTSKSVGTHIQQTHQTQ